MNKKPLSACALRKNWRHWAIASQTCKRFRTVAGNASKYGITVKECDYSPDERDYCTDKRTQTFAKVMKECKANFAKSIILYIYESAEGYSVVAIDKAKKLVVPLDSPTPLSPSPLTKKVNI
jgi:hypothetical protein